MKSSEKLDDSVKTVVELGPNLRQAHAFRSYTGCRSLRSRAWSVLTDESKML